MKRHSAWMRIAIVISFFWLLAAFLFGLTSIDAAFFSPLIAIILLLIFWAIWWIVSGFRSAKTDKAEDEKVEIDSFTKALRGLEVKLNKVESELSEIEKTK